MNPTVGDVVAVLDRLYDPAWAESWDAVGLVTGDPEQPVRRILFAVDPMRSVVDEAIAGDFDQSPLQGSDSKCVAYFQYS